MPLTKQLYVQILVSRFACCGVQRSHRTLPGPSLASNRLRYCVFEVTQLETVRLTVSIMSLMLQDEPLSPLTGRHTWKRRQMESMEITKTDSISNDCS